MPWSRYPLERGSVFGFGLQSKEGLPGLSFGARPHPVSEISIRPLNEDDAREFQELRLRGFRDHPYAFGTSYQREMTYTVEQVASRIGRTAEAPDNLTLGAFLDDVLIGTVVFVRRSSDVETHRGHIWGMYVVSEHQSKGIGRALLTRTIEHARSLPGLEQIELEVESYNESAIGLYSSLGFVLSGIDPRARIVDGQYIDDERMVLFL